MRRLSKIFFKTEQPQETKAPSLVEQYFAEQEHIENERRKSLSVASAASGIKSSAQLPEGLEITTFQQLQRMIRETEMAELGDSSSSPRRITPRSAGSHRTKRSQDFDSDLATEFDAGSDGEEEANGGRRGSSILGRQKTAQALKQYKEDKQNEKILQQQQQQQHLQKHLLDAGADVDDESVSSNVSEGDLSAKSDQQDIPKVFKRITINFEPHSSRESKANDAKSSFAPVEEKKDKRKSLLQSLFGKK